MLLLKLLLLHLPLPLPGARRHRRFLDRRGCDQRLVRATQVQHDRPAALGQRARDGESCTQRCHLCHASSRASFETQAARGDQRAVPHSAEAAERCASRKEVVRAHGDEVERAADREQNARARAGGWGASGGGGC